MHRLRQVSAINDSHPGYSLFEFRDDTKYLILPAKQPTSSRRWRLRNSFTAAIFSGGN